MIEVRIAGPQFSDPHLFVQWLWERYGVKPVGHVIGGIDRIVEMTLPGDIHIVSSAPACWEPQKIYARIFDRADAVLLLLNRIEHLRRLNGDVIDLVKPHLERLRIEPIVAANDPHGGNPEFPTVPGDALRPEVEPSWPIFETTIGPFESRLRWAEGANAVWDAVLTRARHSSR